MTARDGWTPGRYEVAMGKAAPDGGWERTGTETARGETWESFGMERCPSDWVWVVTHLPSGMGMASFERKTDAKRFCRLIARVTDWQAITITEDPPDGVRAAVLAAMDRCHAVSLVRIL